MADIPNREELEKKLARRLSQLQREHLKRLLDELGSPPRLENLSSGFWDQIARELAAELAPFLEEIYLEQATALMMEQPIGPTDWALIHQEAVAWARSYSFDLVKGINRTSQQALQKAVSAFFEQGQTFAELERSLSGIFGPLRAELIAVTEVTRAAAEGEYEIAKDLRIQGVNMRAFWETNRDELVCPICAPLADREAAGLDALGRPYWVHPVTGNTYQHPAHPRCRCWPRHALPLPG